MLRFRRFEGSCYGRHQYTDRKTGERKIRFEKRVEDPEVAQLPRPGHASVRAQLESYLTDYAFSGCGTVRPLLGGLESLIHVRVDDVAKRIYYPCAVVNIEG
jgi:hypothetical protein